ncbi:MAG: DedA family protein [bacterium]|nr:DedA family protein [bacterium]
MEPVSGFFGFVTEYGYLAVFLLVFIQELGIPTVPNELILIFAGALTTIGELDFWAMFWITVAADVIGTSILYFIFYFFEKKIMERIPKWLPINHYLDKIKAKIEKHDKWAIFIGRMLPYGRGYVSAAAGILNISYRTFLPMVVLSAIIWTGGYVTLGHFLGYQWKHVADFVAGYQWVVVVAFLIVVIGWVYWSHRKKKAADVKLNNGSQANDPK